MIIANANVVASWCWYLIAKVKPSGLNKQGGLFFGLSFKMNESVFEEGCPLYQQWIPTVMLREWLHIASLNSVYFCVNQSSFLCIYGFLKIDGLENRYCWFHIGVHIGLVFQFQAKLRIELIRSGFTNEDFTQVRFEVFILFYFIFNSTTYEVGDLNL